MEQLPSHEVAINIIKDIEQLKIELDDWIINGKKIAAKRARKLTLSLTKIMKDFRSLSVKDSE
jgi:hypothetical protein